MSGAFGSLPLQHVELLAACHPSLVLGKTNSIEIGRLEPHPLLLLDPSFVFRRVFDAACRLAQLKPNIFVESHTPQTLLALAEAGHGVAVIPSQLQTRHYRLRIVAADLSRSAAANTDGHFMGQTAPTASLCDDILRHAR